MGEFSSARQALEGAPVALGNRTALHVLRDPSKRPAEPCDPIPQDVSECQAASRLEVDIDGFARVAKRGAASGPSGKTAERVRPVLESESDTAGHGEKGHRSRKGQRPFAPSSTY